jgi:hypothetical protein
LSSNPVTSTPRWQQEMYPGLSPLVRVHAPLGPDLIDYLSRIASYNRRAEAPSGGWYWRT